MVAAPAGVLAQLAAASFVPPRQNFKYKGELSAKQLKTIPFEANDLNAPWEGFDVEHEPTVKTSVLEDDRNTLAPAAQPIGFVDVYRTV